MAVGSSSVCELRRVGVGIYCDSIGFSIWGQLLKDLVNRNSKGQVWPRPYLEGSTISSFK
jgi:hypothetical protein